MNSYEAIKKYLEASAPPGGFTVLGVGDETTIWCSALGAQLRADWTVLSRYASVDPAFPTVEELRRHGEHNHYNVALVPPVLHQFKDWYVYLEAILALADIVIFETVHTQEHEKQGTYGAYNFGLYMELRKMGDVIHNAANLRLWVVNKNKLQGEEAQVAMMAEILRGFDANTPDDVFSVSYEDGDAIAQGLVTALRYHGWVLNYDPAITAANLNKVIAANQVPQTEADYNPVPLSAPIDRQSVWPAWDGKEPWPGDPVLDAWK